MCGIFGVINCLDEQRFKNALSLLNHGGPDDFGLYIDCENQIALGHTRLSIIDTSSNGKQPMVSESKRFIISYNGEIYNYESLRSELTELGYIFKSTTDTEVILNLYVHMGSEMIDRLDGIFSIAIYDKEAKKVFLARDRFGIKPLYFYHSEESFVFSSETKPISFYLEDKLNLNKSSFLMSLKYLWNPLSSSFIEGIEKIEPGSFLEIESSKIKKHKFSSPPLVNQKNSSKKIQSRDAAKKAVFSVLKKTVEDQMISDVPLGSFLSGGLDSSSIAYFASKINENLECFTIKTSDAKADGFEDDLPYAKKVAKFLGVNLNICELSSDSLIDNIEETVSIMNEPISDPAIFNTYLICKEAKKNNIKVLLSGTGGDDIFTGYRRHKALLLNNKIRKWVNLGNVNFLNRLLNENIPTQRRVKKFLTSFKDGSNKITGYFSWADKEILNLILKPKYQEIMNQDPLMDYLDLTCKDSNLSDLDQMLSLEQRFFLSDHNLHYTDKMSMAAGIEVRVPFLGEEITKLASKIDEKLLINLFSSKRILKDSMTDCLPREIIHRPKTGFGAPIRKWVKSDLKAYIKDKITIENIKKTDILDYKGVMKLIKLNQDGKVDASYTIMQILSLIIWNDIRDDNL